MISIIIATTILVEQIINKEQNSFDESGQAKRMKLTEFIN